MAKYGQLNRYGAIAKKLPFSVGKIFFVVNSAETYLADLQEQFPTDSDGVDRVYTSLSAAYDATVSNRNDVIMIDGNAAHALTAMLTVSKSRVHFEGMSVVDGRKNSQGSRIELATAVAGDVAVIKNTGTRNTFRNLKIVQNGTNTAQTSAFIDEGEGTFVEFCNLQVNTLLTTVTQDLLFAGDTCHYKDCQIGTATVYRDVASGNSLLIAVSNGAYPRYSYFENCTIIIYSSATTAALIRCTGIVGWIKFENCTLLSAKKGDGGTAGGATAEGVVMAATSGYLLFDNRCTSFNCAKFAEADAYILNASPVGVAAARGGEGVAGA